MQWIASQVRRAMGRIPEGTLQSANINTNKFTVDSLHPGHANILGYSSSLPGNASKPSLALTDTDVEDLGEVNDIIASYGELGHGELLKMSKFMVVSWFQ